MKLYIFLIVSYVTFASSENYIEDYCWRDYNGETPTDAFKCGNDPDGNPIYVGQVMYENKLIPGKIHYNDPKIHFEYYRAYTANETVKILCVRHPERFQWIHVKYYDVFRMTDTHFFQGGYEKGYDTYVGRVESHGSLTVGKVICSPTNCIRLTTVENGTWYDHDAFEILAYDPDAVIYQNPYSVEGAQTITPATTIMATPPALPPTLMRSLEGTNLELLRENQDEPLEAENHLPFPVAQQHHHHQENSLDSFKDKGVKWLNDILAECESTQARQAALLKTLNLAVAEATAKFEKAREEASVVRDMLRAIK